MFRFVDEQHGPMTSTIAEFNDPRLVAIYDSVNSYEADAQPGFYLKLAAKLRAHSIVDLGCGTGLITCEFARRGYRVIGVDPAPEMVAAARRRAVCDGVRWIVGDASMLGAVEADLAIMTGHVAPFFLTDDSWLAALIALHRALRAGGRLAFESRNPDAREWQSWTKANRKSVEDPAAGRIETWAEVQDARDGIVSYTIHYLFLATGAELVSTARLRFRTEGELRRSLATAGFTIEHIYGDWTARPAGPSTRELIVIAAR
jgi:SAM-dependent methyltransferase